MQAFYPSSTHCILSPNSCSLYCTQFSHHHIKNISIMSSSRNSSKPGAYSRNVLHGNSSRGGGAGAIMGVSQPRHFKSKMNHHTVKKTQKTFVDPHQVIVAPPPRGAPLPRGSSTKGPKEMRFTLPNTPNNSDLRIAQIRRAYAASQLVMRDLSTEVSASSPALRKKRVSFSESRPASLTTFSPHPTPLSTSSAAAQARPTSA